MSEVPARLQPEAFALIAARFRVLSDPVRLRLLHELERGEKNVTELVTIVGMSQPSISKHLKTLLHAGIVGRRQDGPSAYYYIVDPGVHRLCEFVCSSLEDQIRAQARQVLRSLGRSSVEDDEPPPDED